MELRHLRYFDVLCQELHFAKAAARLRIAQPALSIQIKNLEHELGTRLLQRSRRKVELTHSGAPLLVEARKTLVQAQNSRSMLRSEPCAAKSDESLSTSPATQPTPACSIHGSMRSTNATATWRCFYVK